MALTLAFDVYGTLIDTHSVVERLQQFLGNDAETALNFSLSWREKQLEYSFRRALMQRYETFTVCTRQALDYTDMRYRTGLSEQQKAELMALYLQLNAFDDVATGLEALNAAGHRLFAFSNGNADAVESLLTTAGIRSQFLDVISMETVQSFKPDPAGYAWFLEQAESRAEESWLISSNPFDVIGALSTGMRSAWVQRSPEALFDPWGITPTCTVTSLAALPQALMQS